MINQWYIKISRNSRNKRHSIITNQGQGLSIVILLSNVEQGYGSAGDINKVVKSTEPKIMFTLIINRILIRNSLFSKKILTCSPVLRKLGIQDIPKDHFHSRDNFEKKSQLNSLQNGSPWIDSGSSGMTITAINGRVSCGFLRWVVCWLWRPGCAVWTVVWPRPRADPVQRVWLCVPIVVAVQLLRLGPSCFGVDDGVGHDHVTLPTLGEGGVGPGVGLKGEEVVGNWRQNNLL